MPDMKQRSEVAFSAPGKLFLLGEYAVLEDAPALLAAVDRRATVRMRASDAWHLRTRPALSDTTVFKAVRNATAARCELPPQDVVIDTRDFFGPAGKLGLGASAAVAAALTGALTEAGGLRPGRAELCNLAMAAHREAQDGTGSGADVATAVHGGVLAFTAGKMPEPLDWLPGLHAAAVITGDGADTRHLVRAVQTFERTEPVRYRSLMQSLAAFAEAGRDAWTAGDSVKFLRITEAYREALTVLGVAAGADIVLPAHQRLTMLAADAGAVFKPSGAGGGDIGLLLADSASALNRARTAVAGAGFEMPELDFGAEGLLPL